MPKFKMYPLRTNNILQLHQWRDKIDLDPPYQRLSIWDEEKQKCLIDSVINGFDIPKLYFHEISSESGGTDGNKYKYAVIDGKQRLLALWEFMDNKWPLAREFVFFEDETVRAGGCNYEDLMLKFPRLRARFDSFGVPITVVQTDDASFVEDLFARLNLQVPLSAPERRNALGGPFPFIIRKIGVHSFFTKSSKIRNDRLQHFDLAAKFLYLTRANAIESTKKEVLDKFVTQFRKFRDAGLEEAGPKQLDALEKKTASTLNEMERYFETKDALLVSQGRATLYFHIFRMHQNAKRSVPFTRQMLAQFNEEVSAARKKSQRRAAGSNEQLSEMEQKLVEFDREKQSPNDGGALTRQYGLFRTYFTTVHGIRMPGPT